MNVPKLRFYGYDDLYKNVKLSTFAQKIFSKNKGNTITNVISNSAIYGLISQRDFFDKDIANNDNTENYYIIEHGDFVYNPRKSNEAPYGPINLYKYEDAGVISPLYLCFRTKNINRNYLEYYFKSPFWYRYIYLNGDSGARHDRVSIKDETFFNMNINIPCLEEQTKVSDFLSLLDKKIELQSKKIEDLKLFKKGLSNDLINGINEYKEFSLKDIGITYSGLSGKSKEDFENGNSKFVSFMSILKDKIEIDKLPTVMINGNEKQNKVQKYDLFFNTSSETKEDVALCSTINEDVDNLYLNSFCFGYRINDLKLVNNEYLNIMLHCTFYRKLISNLGQGFTRVNISKNELMDLVVKVPSIDDQIKIVDIINKVKSIIDLETIKLSKLQELKKGLMQNIFV